MFWAWGLAYSPCVRQNNPIQWDWTIFHKEIPYLFKHKDISAWSWMFLYVLLHVLFSSRNREVPDDQIKMPGMDLTHDNNMSPNVAQYIKQACLIFWDLQRTLFSNKDTETNFLIFEKETKIHLLNFNQVVFAVLKHFASFVFVQPTWFDHVFENLRNKISRKRNTTYCTTVPCVR